MLHKKSPQELTLLLYEACTNNLEQSISAIKIKDYASANEKLQKAYDIIYRLDAGINYESGGIISDQLDTLYEYVAEKIYEANLKKSIPMIEEALTIVNRIAAAWNEAMIASKTTIPSREAVKTSVYNKFSAYEK